MLKQVQHNAVSDGDSSKPRPMPLWSLYPQSTAIFAKASMSDIFWRSVGVVGACFKLFMFHAKDAKPPKRGQSKKQAAANRPTKKEKQFLVVFIQNAHSAIWRRSPRLHTGRQMGVISIGNETAILIVAIVTASISFAALILKVVEVARKK